ncbi:MAG: hypothetical protein WEB52_13580 [Dehalococcoidia bacterium]
MRHSTIRLLFIMSVAILGALSLNVRATHAQEEPADVVDAFAAAVEAGDAAAILALFADDTSFTDISLIGGSFAAIGKPAVALIFEEIAAQNIEIALSGVSVDEDTGEVTGLATLSDNDSDAAGVGRYLQPFSITVVDGLITSANFTYNETDPQTRAYLEYVSEQEEDDGGGEPGIGELLIELGPGRDGSQLGQAFLFEASPEVTGVGIQIAAGAAGALQPAHIHDGDCPGVGGIASPLASVLNGFSFAFVSIPIADLSAGDYAINIHQSEAQAGLYVACGEVGAVAIEPTPPAPAPSPTPATGVIAPDTGTGPSDGTATRLWLIALLVTGGIGLFAAAAAGATRLRQR